MEKACSSQYLPMCQNYFFHLLFIMEGRRFHKMLKKFKPLLAHDTKIVGSGFAQHVLLHFLQFFRRAHEGQEGLGIGFFITIFNEHTVDTARLQQTTHTSGTVKRHWHDTIALGFHQTETPCLYG